MSVRCLICFNTISGPAIGEICANSLHQIALVMPAVVISYDTRVIAINEMGGLISDDELYDLLVGVVKDSVFTVDNGNSILS